MTVADGTEMTLRNSQITFRNFAGRPTNFKTDGGVRSFAVILEPEVGEAMLADGWNVSKKEPRAQYDETEPRYTLDIAVGYKHPTRKPKVVMLTSKGQTALGEGMVELIDYVNISHCDMIIRARHWSNSGKSGVKAWLNTIYVHVIEDELELEYADVPHTDAPHIPTDDSPSEEPPF